MSESSVRKNENSAFSSTLNNTLPVTHPLPPEGFRGSASFQSSHQNFKSKKAKTERSDLRGQILAARNKLNLTPKKDKNKDVINRPKAKGSEILAQIKQTVQLKPVPESEKRYSGASKNKSTTTKKSPPDFLNPILQIYEGALKNRRSQIEDSTNNDSNDSW